MARARDESWDALVAATHSNPQFEAGRIGLALKAIKQAAQADGILAEDVPGEIRLRADAYHAMWPHLTLTPTALARHWYRVMVVNEDAAANALRDWTERYQ